MENATLREELKQSKNELEVLGKANETHKEKMELFAKKFVS